VVRRRQQGWRQISNSCQVLIAPDYSKALRVVVRQRPLHRSQRPLPILVNIVPGAVFLALRPVQFRKSPFELSRLRRQGAVRRDPVHFA
jgi:hypothetical protein